MTTINIRMLMIKLLDMWHENLPECVQADLKRLYYLWQIYHIKNEMSSAQSTATEQFGELREAAVQLQATEKQIEQLRKQQAGFNKDAVKQEHQMKRRRAEFEKQVLLLIALSP